MILHDANTPHDERIDQNHKGYWTMTIAWTPEYSFLPAVIHNHYDEYYDDNCPNDVLEWIMGLDYSQKDEFGLTDEQLQSTWKAYSATVHYPNNPKAFGINGDTYRYKWKY
jgi:hypothetical protein